MGVLPTSGGGAIRALKIFIVLAVLMSWAPLPAAAADIPRLALSFDKTYYSGSDDIMISGTIINTEARYMGETVVTLSVMPALERNAPLFGRPRSGQTAIAQETWQRDLAVGLTKVDFKGRADTLKLKEGVYPVILAVKPEGGMAFRKRSFIAVLNPNAQRLKVSVVWSFHPGESRSTGGTFVDDRVAELVRSAPDSLGSLQRHLDLLETNPAARVNIAAGATLREQLSALGQGYILEGPEPVEVSKESSAAQDAGAWLARFDQLTDTRQIEPLTSPYGEAPLSRLAGLGWEEDVRGQIALSTKQEKPGGGFYLPGLEIDSFTARRLIESGFEYTVALDGTPTATQTPKPPLRFDHNKKRLTVFSADAEISSWLVNAAPESAGNELTAILAQRYLSAKGDEMVVMASAVDGPPSTELAGRVYGVLTKTPWLEPTALSTQAGKSSKAARVPPPIKVETSEDAYLQALAEARELWLDFTAAVPKDNPIQKRLTRYLFRAQSKDALFAAPDDRQSLGRIYMETVTDMIRMELAKVRLAPPRTITFSTKTGKVPVAIFNGTGYPIKARLALDGKDFTFPGEAENDVTLRPKENLISYDVIADFSGLQVLDIRIRVGGFEIANEEVEVTVSSVLRYIVVGMSIVLTLGLGAILVLRRRKS